MFDWRKLVPKASFSALGSFVGNLIVGVLKAVGVWPSLVAIVIGVITYVWGIITGIPGPIVFVLMLAAFAFVLAIVHGIRILFARRAEHRADADLDEWRKVDPLEIWRAGCLWKGHKPHYPITFGDPAYPSFIRLVNASFAGQISVTRTGAEIDAQALVTRRELARFADLEVRETDFLRRLEEIKSWEGE